MRPSAVLALTSGPLTAWARHGSQRHSTLSSMASTEPKKVAIIGAGAAGSSAAYHLRKFANEADIPLNISIFERNGYIGGRSTTVNAYGSPDLPVELGASIFVQVNHILVNASDKFKLEKQSAMDRAPPGYAGPSLGIWNGEEFVYTQDVNGGWWDYAKLFWRYGTAPVRAVAAMKASVGRFLRMYDPDVFPWKDLGEQIEALGLLEDTSITGEQLLKQKGVGDLFAQELVQASTRVNYAQNLGAIHGLETLVCLATEGAVQIKGGNWQIFSRMAHAATPDIYLNTPIGGISTDQVGSFRLKGTSMTSAGAKALEDGFDEIIIATPLQFADLALDPEPEKLPDEIPYVQLHVTLFTSPHLLSPAGFNLPPDAKVPLVVLTTLHPSEKPGSKPSYAGKAGFFSISMLQPTVNPSTGTAEYLYKIFTPHPVSAEFLARILGVKQPKSIEDFDKKDVSWMHKKIWYSYPVEFPRVTFEKLQLAPRVWYSAGIESFISTMETSALAGSNIAKLIVNGWQSAKEAGEPYAQPADNAQQILRAKL